MHEPHCNDIDIDRSSADDAKIPKRGEKDFEPHATALQSNTLAASRQAMHNALSYQRIHNPKGYTRATYHPETNMAYTISPKGPLFTKMGQVLSAVDDPLGNDGLRGQRVWLLPEEVLYMLERGSLDVRWPFTNDDEDEQGLPMSVQGGYAVFIGDEEEHGGALTFERYSVYSGLRRMGYTVQRAQSWDGPGPPPGPRCYPPLRSRQTWRVGFDHWLRSIFTPKPLEPVKDQIEGPLVSPGLYRDYLDIYRRLALIDFHDPTSPASELLSTDPAFRVTFHVWKPGSPNFKKSAPGEPDFRIAVVDARRTTVPSLSQLSALLESTPYAPPPEKLPIYQKLKHGYNNIILAIVDQGVVSYLRLSDAAFGREKLYERTAKPSGGKRGGRGGGRGGRGGRGRGK
nr:putative trna-splicing endonuclease subunit sen54 [Quercus suber]